MRKCVVSALWVGFTLAIFFFNKSSIAQDGNLELFYRANENYQKGNFDKAIEDYEDLIQRGISSSELCYNLANSYFRHSSLGQAIFYYRLAKELDPMDADIDYNLNYARSKSVDKIEQKNDFKSALGNYLLFISEKLSYILLLISTLIALLSSLFLVYRSNLDWMKWTQRASLSCIVLFFVYVVKYQFFKLPFGVLIQDAKVYSAVGKKNVILFALHQGAEFSVLDRIDRSEESWIRVQLSDGKQGWIPQSKMLISN